MWDGIDLVLALQDIRLSAPDFVNQFFIFMSSKLFYLIIPIGIAAAFLWCIDKKKGDFIGLSCLTTMLLAMSLKDIWKVPRPFEKYPEVIVTDIDGINANGYSCPSGHTAIAAAGYGSSAVSIGKKAISAVLILIACLIIFARLYLGAHTPLDIIISLALAAVLLVIYKVCTDLSYKDDRYHYAVSAATLIFFTAFFAVELIFFDTPFENILYSGGFLYGYLIGRILENMYCKYRPIVGLSLKQNLVRYVIGIIPMAILLAAPMVLIGGNIGTGIGGIVSMLWLSFFYPMIMSKKMTAESFS